MTTEESDPIAILDYSTSRSWILVTIRCCREGIPLNQPLWNNHLSFAQRTYWQYTRITPVALEIYEDNSHNKPSIGHSNNTGTHMFIFVRIYTRITPFAVDIYKDNTHIKPSIGHSINTGTHMCIFVRIVGLSTTSMVECLFFCLRDNFFMLAIYLSLVQSAIKSLTH